MTKSLESDTSQLKPKSGPGLAKLGIIAVASALAGGLAAAWWYKKTLTRLQQADEGKDNPHYGIHDEESGEEN
jgi:hypothetical protein